jgi:hypothetical protein
MQGVEKLTLRRTTDSQDPASLVPEESDRTRSKDLC